MVVFIGSVDGVGQRLLNAGGPEVGLVSGEAGTVAVVPELQEARGALASPDAPRVVFANIAGVSAMGAHTDAVENLVGQRAVGLVAHVGAHTYPSAIAAVGRGRARGIVGRGGEACDAGQVCPVVGHTHDCIRDAGLLQFVGTALVEHPPDVALRQRVDFDDVAIAHR